MKLSFKKFYLKYGFSYNYFIYLRTVLANSQRVYRKGFIRKDSKARHLHLPISHLSRELRAHRWKLGCEHIHFLFIELLSSHLALHCQLQPLPLVPLPQFPSLYTCSKYASVRSCEAEYYNSCLLHPN